MVERFPLRWNRARRIVIRPIGPLARFHLSGNARTGDICCRRHIPSGRFRPDGTCSRKPAMELKEIARELQGKAANAALRMPISWVNLLAGAPITVDGRTLDTRTQWFLQLLA